VDSVNDGETGFLYEYGNIQELADRIGLLLDKPDLRTEMGHKGIAWAERYSWDRAADTVLEMINRTIAARRVLLVGQGELKLGLSRR
jgi:glycosyltransferase involved in cell wall biosynthesis